MNVYALFLISSFALIWGTTSSAAALDLTVDFAHDAGEIRPALHSSGWAPRSYPRYLQNDDAAVKSMNLAYARTHDWALVNSGQRVIDYQYLFPLFDKDPKDPSNYYFAATDYLLSLTRNVGLKIFYRLGTSIEHTGSVHFNALVPKDFDKTAEIFAATIRHYNRGWANGYHWNIEYWEIWNEPDGLRNMWCLPEAEGGKDAVLMRKKFITFFVTVLKRLKAEFPEVKVGGPALCGMDANYFTELLQACKDAGVAPDFISWHGYSQTPRRLTDHARTARALCDQFGFTKTELILNEYHYLVSWKGVHGRNASPAEIRKAHTGPASLNGIDSACFYLTALSLFQDSPLDQAYWYGAYHQGNWGYMREDKSFNKPYYAAKAFGEIVRDFPKLGEIKTVDTVTTLVAKSADGQRLTLLVTDYRGTNQLLRIRTSGLGKYQNLSASMLDHTHDLTPYAVDEREGSFTLVKGDRNSAAFIIKINK